MNLEEIKEWYIGRLEKGDRHQTYLDKIDWLIAEIERLKKMEGNYIKAKKDLGEVQAAFKMFPKANPAATATRCAEIVEHEVPACSHPQAYADAIRKEFL